jgi:hypothetical protein
MVTCTEQQVDWHSFNDKSFTVSCERVMYVLESNMEFNGIRTSNKEIYNK